MKETRFIAQNKEKWLESETLLKDPVKDPEKLSNLFTQVVDDLSYSRTYYPHRTVRVYLNKMAREYFSIISGSQKEKKNRFKSFWLDELPQIVIFCRKPLLLSLIIFLTSAAIGVFSAYNDPQFTSSILTESYVSMTKANIEKGDPMAVYKQRHQVDMFLGITFNNLLVAFRTYVCGIFLSIGTIAILLYNGIMVGCFQFFFIERGLFAESALTIWLHGTLEISSIILAGGAGLTLGSGLIFPGTYSRLQAFQLSAIRSLKLMLGVAPILVLAALIESFLTRYTETPDSIRLLLILLSAVFIVGYFVVYPWLKSKRGFDTPLTETKLQPSQDDPVSYTRIKNNAELIKDTFLFYKRNINTIIRWVATVTLLMTIAHIYVVDPGDSARLTMSWTVFFNALFFALKTPEPIFILINALGSGLIVYGTFHLMTREMGAHSKKFWSVKSLVQIPLILSIIYALFYSIEGWGVVLVMLTFVFLFLTTFTQHVENVNFISGMTQAAKRSLANAGQLLGLQFILLLMGFSFMIVLSAPILYIHTSVLTWNLSVEDTWTNYVINFIEVYTKLLGFNLLLPILAVSVAYFYFTLGEILNADHLKRSIELISNKVAKTTKR
jgi:uncharacterized membrane protein SpoIIM required for sporulation